MRNYITYIPLRTVIQDLQSMVDSIDWDEDRMYEWAAKGYLKINLPAKYEDYISFLKVTDHSLMLPGDIKYINQIFYSTNLKYEGEAIKEIMKQIGITEDKPFYEHMAYPENLAKKIYETSYWKNCYMPLRRSSSLMGVSPCAQEKIPDASCQHTYTIKSQQYLETSFRNGCVVLSYKRLVMDCNGDFLIPDNEDLKDALFHFCMYRWWMSRMTYKEEGSGQQMAFHEQKYKTLTRKASANLSMPDIDTLENIKNTKDRLVPRTNMYDSAFSRLSNRENIDF